MSDRPTETSRIGFAHDRDIDNGKEEWLTPPELIKSLAEFDLDPCSPINRPWPTAKKHFTVEDDGLMQKWDGFVFCNPPYGSKTGDWLAKCAEHDNCIALVFARTETKAFQAHVFPKAKSLFFIAGRISFYHVTGARGGASGAPSMLIAYGTHADNILRGNAKIAGHYIANKLNMFTGI